ncbi:MAG: alpha/beta fold hydrolase [Chloroflexota bacterium]
MLTTEADYWQIYHDRETVQRSNSLRQEVALRSTSVDLHIDVYPHPESEAGLIIFNHGAAGYCRLFAPLALAFYDLGYSVMLPDQRGQGFSGGRSGDYTVAECVQNIVDAAAWGRTHFSGPLFLAGGSVGGAYTYYAAAAGAPAQAIACLNLFDFGNRLDGMAISRLAWMRRYPTLARLATASMSLAKSFDGLRLPFAWFAVFERLMDEGDAVFQAQWDADPVPPRLVTLRALASSLDTPPAIPFEKNLTPTLVINQSRDRMVDPAVTRRNYQRLGGPKRYLEIPFGHWSAQRAFWDTIVNACDQWFKENRGEYAA